jgi:WS/DGAT/MGAT family acyltransferase
VAKLHEPMLDRDKPLWQMHFIDDETSDSFAILFTIHHLYGDGASMIKWFQECYDTAPSDTYVAPWTQERHKRQYLKKNALLSLFSNLWHFVLTIFDIVVIFFRLLLKALRIYPVYMPLPFSGTKTILTGQVSSGRVVTTTILDFDELKQLSNRLRASINEVVLCCFDISIHKFLNDRGQKFHRALLTQMPINMRRPNDPVGGNRIAIVPVQLAYGKKDPYLRLRQIIENHRVVKGVGKRVYPAAFSYYTIVIQGLALLFEALRLSSFFKPLGTMLVSNMAGPKDAVYCKDSRLEALCPISTLTPGGGVNITMLTYNNKANIGLVCCDKEVDSLEPMAIYFNEAFELLKQSIDNPELSLDDLGEIDKKDYKSILEEPATKHSLLKKSTKIADAEKS